MEPYTSDDVKRKKRKKDPKKPDDNLFTAMGAAIISLTKRSLEDLNVGELKRIIIESEESNIVLYKRGDEVIVEKKQKENDFL